jgi:hypothetical protein
MRVSVGSVITWHLQPPYCDFAGTLSKADHPECLGAVFDSDPPVTTTTNNGGLLGGLLGGGTTTTVGPNCILQGNALSSITTTSDTSVVAFVSGRCEEQNAGTGTYCKSDYLTQIRLLLYIAPKGVFHADHQM